VRHVVASCWLLVAGVTLQQPAAGAQQPTRVFALNETELARAKTLVRAKSSAVRPAYEALIHDADDALKAPLVAVTDKRTLLPPSGDKHDYFSLSPYWWPDSAKPNGLPYIRRDGQTNPESKRDLDQPRVAALGANVHALALAYYLSGNEKYAARAATQIRRWFLDSATTMNPHLRYSQLVRGIDQERGSGIIDTRWFIEVVDAVGLIAGSRAWTEADQRGMEQWFKAYLTWLRTTANGKHEHEAKNNHGSWYAAQVGTYAMFVGDTAVAREVVNETKTRIGVQITADGAQPEEMKRTRSMHYSAFNVEALSRVAEIGKQLRVDLWSFQSPQGGSLRKAVDHLAKYAADPSKWPGEQITPVLPVDLIIHFRRAARYLGDARYRETLRLLPARAVRMDRSALLYPESK
jgi:hypothetical protein